MKPVLTTLVIFISCSRALAAPVFQADPAALIAMTFQQFLTIYPDECKKVTKLTPLGKRTAPLYSDLPGDVYRCEITHRSDEIVPGYVNKLNHEYLYIQNGRIFQVSFKLKQIGGIFDHLEKAYGPPWTPEHAELEDNSRFGKIDYSIGGDHTSVDDFSVSYSSSWMWFKPTFIIALGFSSSHVFSDDALNSAECTVDFYQDRLSPETVPTMTPAMLQQAAANSESAKTSQAAVASLASVGHILTPQELADLVKNAQASKCAVVTNPSGADVYVDGNRAGVSPLAFTLLRKGDTPRKITVSMRGYKTVEKEVVPDGKIIPMGLTLDKQPKDK